MNKQEWRHGTWEKIFRYASYHFVPKDKRLFSAVLWIIWALRRCSGQIPNWLRLLTFRRFSQNQQMGPLLCWFCTLGSYMETSLCAPLGGIFWTKKSEAKVVHTKISLPVIRRQSLALTWSWQESSFNHPSRKSLNRLRKTTAVFFYAVSLTCVNQRFGSSE